MYDFLAIWLIESLTLDLYLRVAHWSECRSGSFIAQAIAQMCGFQGKNIMTFP